MNLLFVVLFDLEMGIIEGVSFGLIEQQCFNDRAKISLEFVFHQGKGQEVGELDVGDYFLFFELVFHFVNLVMEEYFKTNVYSFVNYKDEDRRLYRKGICLYLVT